MTDDEQFLIEERAGIKQFCGNMTREEAERQALAELQPEPKKAQ